MVTELVTDGEAFGVQVKRFGLFPYRAAEGFDGLRRCA